MAWTSPRTWVAGETVTAALLNTHVRDNLLELNGTASAWTAFTPTWTAATTNPVIGNGTLSGRFKQVGKIVFFRVKILAGSTTTYGTGVYTVGALPVAAHGTADPLSSQPGILLGSNGTFPVETVQTSTTTVTLVYTGNVSVAQSAPCTLVSGGYIHISGSYEAA